MNKEKSQTRCVHTVKPVYNVNSWEPNIVQYMQVFNVQRFLGRFQCIIQLHFLGSLTHGVAGMIAQDSMHSTYIHFQG